MQAAYHSFFMSFLQMLNMLSFTVEIIKKICYTEKLIGNYMVLKGGKMF